jgi:hypothetical protein
MNRLSVILALSFAGACAQAPPPVEPETPSPEPEQPRQTEWVDDCREELTDRFADAVFLRADETQEFTGASLCNGDLDLYLVEIPPGQYASIRIDIDGSGKGNTDLDLWWLEDPSAPEHGLMDVVVDRGSTNVLWASDAQFSWEELAWYNPTTEPVHKFVAVRGAGNAEAFYDLKLTVDLLDEGRDCMDFWRDSSECNKMMFFPQANSMDDGYLVTHQSQYSYMRREVIYLVRWAARETALAFPGTNPLALMDMTQEDGDTPGRLDDRLRHPEGTHVRGGDIDIAYYQNRTDNRGREVCTRYDQYFCKGPADLLDARRTAYFMAALMSTEYIRVIGVDPEIAESLLAVADDLMDEGLISRTDVQNLNTYMAYGDGWPFHHHHMHFSWAWEE